MSDDAGRQDLADQLLALPVPELADVLSRVLPAHASTTQGIRQCLVLAQVSHYQGGREHQDIAAVAWPDRDHCDGGFGPEPDLWQGGTCGDCGIEVVSTAKKAACPACGAACYLT